MYILKKLKGVNAVQTLSRLNRICAPYDKKTFVLDFVNSYEDIKSAKLDVYKRQTYMWVYRNSPAHSSKPIILYDWQPSRRTDHPIEFLKAFSGIAITDGYQVYHKLSKERPDLLIGGCWIHARRTFADFIKSIKGSADGTIAYKAYSLITEMLHINNGFDDLPSDCLLYTS